MKTVSFVAMLSATSAKWGFGECPTVEFMETLDMPAYAGKWYEVYRDKHNAMEWMADCVTKEFETNENDNLDLYFRGFYNAWGFGKYRGVGGEISDCGHNGLADSTCMATMGHKKPYTGQKRPFNMLATDYKSYDISYFCWSWKGMVHVTNLGISSRSIEMSEETQEEVRKVLHQKLPGYDLSQGMYWTKQGEDSCQYKWMADNNGTIPVEW